MANQAPPKLLTVDQVADRLQVSKWSVYRRVSEGSLPALKLGHGPRSPIRIDTDELETWLRAEPEQENL
jgi:excisionase family DNA binding protein